jgi:hypothetical protein
MKLWKLLIIILALTLTGMGLAIYFLIQLVEK